MRVTRGPGGGAFWAEGTANAKVWQTEHARCLGRLDRSFVAGAVRERKEEAVHQLLLLKPRPPLEETAVCTHTHLRKLYPAVRKTNK